MKQLLIRLDDDIHSALDELPNKSEFVRQAILEKLSGTPGVPAAPQSISREEILSMIRLELAKQPVSNTFVPRPPDPELGYPCCQKNSPCKHWTFDGVEDIWTNTLTGATREA